jgi:hypothetical protein
MNYRSLSGLALAVCLGIGTYGVMGIVAAWWDWQEIQMLQDAIASGSLSEEKARENDSRQGLMGIFQTVTLLASAILFLMWVYRANKNARALGATDMDFTPGWSVGWYFIPIMNLFKPYQSMKEIWKASHPDADTDWRAMSVSPIVPLWWALWLVSAFLGRLAGRLALRADEMNEFLTASRTQLVADLLDLPTALLAIALVHNISQMQEMKRRRVWGEDDQTDFSTDEPESGEQD